MLPFGLSTVTLVRTDFTSTIVMFIEASLAGSICTRIAGVCWPPTSTWPTPGSWESCCSTMFSA